MRQKATIRFCRNRWIYWWYKFWHESRWWSWSKLLKSKDMNVGDSINTVCNCTCMMAMIYNTTWSRYRFTSTEIYYQVKWFRNIAQKLQTLSCVVSDTCQTQSNTCTQHDTSILCVLFRFCCMSVCRIMLCTCLCNINL